MNKSVLIALAVALPFVGYILFSESFNSESTQNKPNDVVTETTVQLEKTGETLVLVPEGYRRLEDYTIVIDVAVLPGMLSALWVEYGTDAAAMDIKTPLTINELGMGVAGEYGGYGVVIDPVTLQPGISYFYRVVGETTDGTILYSGLNRFTAGK